MTEVTIPEMVRRLESVERRQSGYVSKEVYDRDHREMRQDVGEIKDSQKWAMRLLVGQFVALIVGLLILVLGALP